MNCHEVLEKIKNATFVTGIYYWHEKSYRITAFNDTEDMREGMEFQIGRKNVAPFRCFDWDVKKKCWTDYRSYNDIKLTHVGEKALEQWIAEFCEKKYYVPNPNQWEISKGDLR